MKAATLAKLGSELISVVTTLLIDGMALIDLRGRITRMVLNAFNETDPGISSMAPVTTTKKSIIFQPSLR
jgi:hypothetical protein